MIKLCVFDFDSTLMDGETIDFFANAMGVGEEVSVITEKAMQGELDFFESLTRRVGLLRGLDVSRVNEICTSLPYMPNTKACIDDLKARGIKVVVFSGGFKSATNIAKEALGFDAHFSNTLHVKEGKLTGLVGGEMMFDTSKGEMLQALQALLHVKKEETMAVGDGANDRSMFAHAGTRVAFCAKPILKQAANVIVDHKDLNEILNHL
ncbi:phosphoserine phosphatase SerB [Sulfurospirillum sp. T05]|uniref:Phosphoserine phosphatase n=1 Tax=Sulfurospirillum tamanense TaxID=2813362 RepID=A0ABS2WP53_9BACT|nr:phosphoserine phosphatase SerB [Sulfurospirillum tamanensis]MBN2963412.1 phosphoserine phosphatase SerB [Sulfurospirillum tamanensis]